MLRYVSFMGVGGTTQSPIGGWCTPHFSMGRVKSGWMSKFQDLNCSRSILEWSG